MAAGDTFQQGISAIAAGAYFNIQPGTGVEVIIHNISHSGDAQLEFYDGTNSIAVDAQVGNGSWMGMFLHCTNSKYYRVKNTSSASINVACDGMNSKG